jgi:acetyl esterase/lipase
MAFVPVCLAEEKDNPRPAVPVEVQAVRDIVYRDLYPGEDASKGKNKLDLFLPRNRKDFPVVFFVHGGGWRAGDKDYVLGVYSNLGMFLARQGIGTVVTNYRLSPGVQHPEHIKDVARAFAWTCKNIAAYGGRTDQIFACGHSAGGHLVSLLATDESYLKAVGLGRNAICGVIPISGVYDVSSPAIGLFETAFGKDLEVRKNASPLSHVCDNAPPFLILYADRDFLTCDRTSEAFCQALRAKRCEAQTVEVKDRNHLSILVGLTKPSDPAAKAILDFIAGHSGNRTAAAGS